MCQLANPCQNGATCVQVSNQVQCICSKGWTGFVCDIPLLSCEEAAIHKGVFHLSLFLCCILFYCIEYCRCWFGCIMSKWRTMQIKHPKSCLPMSRRIWRKLLWECTRSMSFHSLQEWGDVQLVSRWKKSFQLHLPSWIQRFQVWGLGQLLSLVTVHERGILLWRPWQLLLQLSQRNIWTKVKFYVCKHFETKLTTLLIYLAVNWMKRIVMRQGVQTEELVRKAHLDSGAYVLRDIPEEIVKQSLPVVKLKNVLMGENATETQMELITCLNANACLWVGLLILSYTDNVDELNINFITFLLLILFKLYSFFKRESMFFGLKVAAGAYLMICHHQIKELTVSCNDWNLAMLIT